MTDTLIYTGYEKLQNPPKPPKKFARVVKQKPNKIGFHVCVPLYRGLSKAMQTGWVQMGSNGVLEWDNTTDISFFVEKGIIKDKNLYCGTCGRIMRKGRRPDLKPEIKGTIELI